MAGKRYIWGNQYVMETGNGERHADTLSSYSQLHRYELDLEIYG